MFESVDFEEPWRPVHEWPMALSWLAASAMTLAVTATLPVPHRAGVLATLGCLGIAAWRTKQALERSQARKRAVEKTRKQFITPKDLTAKLKDGRFWLGRGFTWTDIEARKMHALIGKGVAETFGKEFISDGAHWLHGLAKEEDVYAELSLLEGHTLIVGSTGVGKTRLFDLLIGQAIARGEPVIIIDPKGDHGLAENARRMCEAMGQPERFVYFHPAHPEKSACIDPLRNWNRKTELASRIAALIPSETGADPFTAFGWKVLNDIVNGLIATGQRPNLVQLRRYVEGGPDDLLLKALRRHFREHVNDWESRISGFIKQYKGNQLLAYISFYKQVVIHEAQNVDLDGLISTYEHNREHFQKMVASLIPILSMLTSDPLTELLSPDFEPGHDRVVTDMARIIRADKVMYVGLDSLADSTVGSAIGSILLADLTAVAGDRYNYGIDSIKPINVFVDEAAEVINNPTIQLLNKGRGAGFRMTIATQTFADFASRLGDENKARQVLANTNNKIALRVQDAETQKYIADGIPKIKARSMMVRYGHNVDTAIHDTYTASYQEQSMEEEADLIPPAILSELPPLHYFARLSGGRTIKGRIPILV
ncbi:MAG: conjugative transfer system coupling protein TraD [Tepidimonas ignava]|uniref:conjugative transfer system coupling protein TraD n=1 Tax=Tepidimonas ignava TaxID=114249 RepID=UPI00391A341D